MLKVTTSGCVPDIFIKLYNDGMDSNLLDFIKQDSTRLKEGREGLNLASASRLRIETASWMLPDLQCNLMRLSVSTGSLVGREEREEMRVVRKRNLGGRILSIADTLGD